MKKILYLAICLSLGSMLGCAGTCGPCGSSSSIFGNGPLIKNQPVRDTIRSWFRGDECSTCNPPAGQTQFGNVAPLCDTCGSDVGIPTGQPIYSGSPDPGIPLYSDPNLNSPVGTQFSPGPAIQDGSIDGQILSQPGQIPMEGANLSIDWMYENGTAAITPPNF